MIVHKVYIIINPSIHGDNMSLQQCKDRRRFSLDTCVIKRIVENPNYIVALGCNVDFSNSEIIISSTAVDEIQKFGIDLNVFSEKLSKVLGVDVRITNTTLDVLELSIQLYEKYCEDGLHTPDDIHMAFAKITNSVLVTCDKSLAYCCFRDGVHYINPDRIATRQSQWRSLTV